jgi:hypothetical protein
LKDGRLATRTPVLLFEMSIGGRESPGAEKVRQMDSLSKGSTAAGEALRSRKTLLREHSPETSSIELFGKLNVAAKNAMSASLARPSTGGACTAIFN